ncbi:MAG: fumarylacetoacetate hydrolase family protein [Pseudomonadota bacterium]
MKLATLDVQGRDGQLVVVSKDLARCVDAGSVAPNLQAALDEWGVSEASLADLSARLNSGEIEGAPFDPKACASPLPRAYQWADGSAYINHVELVRKARGAEVPETFYSDPLMYQGGSDAFLKPTEDIPLGDIAWGCDMEGEVAVIVDDVPQGVTADAALEHIKLIMLCNDVSLRGLIPAELAKGFGFFQSKPSSAFSPVAVTPDELGDAWRDALVHLPLHVDLNGAPFGRAEAGVDATFSLAELVAHAAKTRPLGAGAIVGSGTVSNKDENGGAGRPVSDGGKGYSCIAEIRMIETINDGSPKTPFLSDGDHVRVEMLDANGASIFGAIDQRVTQI